MSNNNLNNNISNNDSINSSNSIKYNEHLANLNKAINDYSKKLEENLDKNTDLCSCCWGLGYLPELKDLEADIQIKEYEKKLSKALVIVKDDNKNAKRNTEAISETRYLYNDGSNKNIVPEESAEEVKSIASKKAKY
ncbi:hypothetical protein [Brachyspira hampsonii]|uniref:hypothetical protein n=1 Tax=Brachyspira hampsonii TaxID=1287055 RepID=UPI000D38F9BE|nr:hypothetical protein [Brachyspira hampsonii]